MSELKAKHVVDVYEAYTKTGDDEAAKVYLKDEADKVIKSITEGTISMFRDSNRCRGLDLESPLGRIANAAFKHWCFVEYISSKNTQLQEDKERLLQNNHHLLDEVERLKEDVADARQKACGYQEIINEMERQERHQKYKRCLAMAGWCEATALWCYPAAHTLPTGFRATLFGKPVMIEPDRLFDRFERLIKWSNRWMNLAKKFKDKEAK